jgi:hypothetical protein
MTNIGNKIIVQTFKVMLRINIHFKVRKRVHRKLKFFNLKMNLLLYIYRERERCFNKGKC